ncbi:MAG: hypothetical protein GX444_18000 [Myxococcales bacterium]|nr:hypothetical protein [Myxococcales bacterium]
MDLATAQADLTIYGPRDCGSFAAKLGLADLNDDGCDDLIIADSAAILPHSTGVFFVQFGSPDLKAGTVWKWREQDKPDWTVYLNHESYLLGSSFATGDFDGDGIVDLAIAGDDYWVGGGGRGVVHLLRGPLATEKGTVRDLASQPAELTINGHLGTASLFGEGLALGDLNQDGRADLAIANRYLLSEGNHGAVYLIYGRDFGAAPMKWDLAKVGADVRVQTGTDPRFQWFGWPLVMADFNDDRRTDLVVGDQSFGATLSGALAMLDSARFGKGAVIDLTVTPPDLTVVGQTQDYSYGQNFSAVCLAAAAADSGGSLWFADRDAWRGDQRTGEVWHVSAGQLHGSGAVLPLDTIAPVDSYYGLGDMGFGWDLLVGTFDDNEARDLAVSANLFFQAADGGKYRGAVSLFFDRLAPEAPVDDDTADDDTSPAPDDDQSPADDDAADDDIDGSSDDDDDNDEGCGC